VEADKSYKVAGWAPVAEGASGAPIWDVSPITCATRRSSRRANSIYRGSSA